ncbi:phosphoglyceromutase [Actinomadura algeriensis]|uniref:2,3-bisphosphoglycerate-dependent phosphoglycerate mutase n=1 Tax=Actinomadura algeriensis TaxID=1679523 RepID=A0ABR9JSB2_9ACTN|nr:phosphoglyceromutase [Actinomadura algeriensis]MBE1533465.1 2,3-bisphosphoglycerate-dependent phosphoglycerate mutase [Actinomadura algeriensis]
MATLVLLRHGESVWNAEGLFTGWVDVDLSAKGESEATRGGDLLLDADITPDVLHTSLLKRAIRTANIALDVADLLWIPVRRSWRLNERHYGALQGKNKAQTREQYGEEKFMTWRRSYDTPPPPIKDGDPLSQVNDLRYAELPSELIPRSECLADVIDRMLPYWYDSIVPDLAAGRTVLVAAHGNSLRALVKHLDDVSDEDIVGLNIPTGIPLVYELDDDFAPLKRGGEYLDPAAAKAAIEAVKNQGAAKKPAGKGAPKPPAPAKAKDAKPSGDTKDKPRRGRRK